MIILRNFMKVKSHKLYYFKLKKLTIQNFNKYGIYKKKAKIRMLKTEFINKSIIDDKFQKITKKNI